MHASVHQFFRDYTKPEMFKGKTIIEVGSYDVNGSVRDAVEASKPKSYLGVDFIAGPRVDQVIDAVDLVKEFGKNSFDVVISTEMLEHAEHWRVCVNNMKDLTKDLLIITTRGPGFPLHSYPHDWWRYTPENFADMFADFDIEINMHDTDPTHPGVFFIGRKTRRKRVDLSKIDLMPAPTK
jgi:hypothetical protein